MRKKSAKQKTLQEILDSDDELPFEYIDLPILPAYLMNNRFDHIEKENEVKARTEETDKEKTEQRYQQHRTQQWRKGGLSNQRSVVGIGYLKKKDTFCFQCLEPYTSKNTQQWFFNFLIVKDLNASYTFLTACLVPSYGMVTLCKQS